MGKKLAVIFLVLLISIMTMSSAFALSWRGETYDVEVTSQIKTDRLDKGGTTGSWKTAVDDNYRCYVLGTTTTTSHKAIPINLNSQTMCSSTKVVTSGASVSFSIQWYKTDRSLRLLLSKNGNNFEASGNSSASFE